MFDVVRDNASASVERLATFLFLNWTTISRTVRESLLIVFCQSQEDVSHLIAKINGGVQRGLILR
jgi:hypothetical protein